VFETLLSQSQVQGIEAIADHIVGAVHAVDDLPIGR
jgi:hypothetical protein